MASEPNTSRCPRCGTATYRTRIGTSDGLASIWTCWCCGWLKHIDDHRQGMTRQVKKNRNTRVPCSVVGCTNMIHVENNTTGRCTKCNRLMADWEKSAKTRPAPLIQVLGRWIKNPAREK